jgi:hypothetical protein
MPSASSSVPPPPAIRPRKSAPDCAISRSPDDPNRTESSLPSIVPALVTVPAASSSMPMPKFARAAIVPPVSLVTLPPPTR